MPAIDLTDYNYELPKSAIAQEPAEPRDSAKLLIYNRTTDQVSFSQVKNLAKFLPPHAILVLNNTKVLPARLTLKKSTGGQVKVLYLATQNKKIIALVNKRLRLGENLFLGNQILFTVVAYGDQKYQLTPNFPLGQLPNLLEQHGAMPLPPYIKNSPLSPNELKTKYQTVFAQKPGSVAAPTASLHFTPTLLEQLTQQGFDQRFITLHVNLGTFSTLTDEQLLKKQLHEEYYEIPEDVAKNLNQAKQKGRPIIAVGTTVARALESATDNFGKLQTGSGSTRLFIQPGYKFKFIDGLMTNFHVPRSSLLMLVAALTGREKLLNLYQQAIKKDFRFFSFGDSMLIK